MQYKNDGKSEEHYIQNRFTAYLQVSLRRKRIEVLAKRYDIMRHETATETNELFSCAQQNEDQLIHDMDVQIKCQQILQALQNMKARERYIFLARVIEERPFTELASLYLAFLLLSKDDSGALHRKHHRGGQHGFCGRHS